MADATTKTKALGFDLSASVGKARAVKCKLPGDERATFVALRAPYGGRQGERPARHALRRALPQTGAQAQASTSVAKMALV